MKRSKAILIAVTLSAVLGGYAVWGLRPFVLHPPICFEKGVSSGAEETARIWHGTQKFFGPETFGWKRYMHILSHPYERATTPISVRSMGHKTLICTQGTTAFHRPSGFIRITAKEGDWKAFRVDAVTWKAWVEPERATVNWKAIRETPPGVLSTD
jgi:hypothetical protein